MNDLFSAADFAWTIKMRRDTPEAFFAQRDSTGALLERRNYWLDQAPELCLASSPSSQRLVNETREIAKNWGQLSSDSEPTLENLGRNWEADFILLDSETFTLAGGCVCFPSSWNLQESTGKTLDQVHGMVPDLNRQIGDKINRFLKKLAPGQAFLRENWGLTRTGHLNYHPALARPKLDSTVDLTSVFLRIEHQAFIKLPTGVLLGVRIEPVSLEILCQKAPETARRLCRQLETMPHEVAVYKGFDAAIQRICALLK